MICVAHLERDRTGSRASVPLTDRLSDVDYWQGRFGEEWCSEHWMSADAHVAVHVGWDWDIDHIEWFVDMDEFKDMTFDGDDFLEVSNDEA